MTILVIFTIIVLVAFFIIIYPLCDNDDNNWDQ